MPNCNGFEATRRIKAQMPDVQVVMLTVSEDEDDLATAVRCGADGYLLKDLLPEVLFQHLRGLASGETPISRTMTGKLFRQAGRQLARQSTRQSTRQLTRQLTQDSQPAAQPQVAVTDVLSARENQVLALVTDGYSNQEIADALGIALNTVKNHLRNILAKLGVRNRAQAAAYAVNHGLTRANRSQ
jgi:DNA-binding NarL/FixJ family response regulator